MRATIAFVKAWIVTWLVLAAIAVVLFGMFAIRQRGEVSLFEFLMFLGITLIAGTLLCLRDEVAERKLESVKSEQEPELIAPSLRGSICMSAYAGEGTFVVRRSSRAVMPVNGFDVEEILEDRSAMWHRTIMLVRANLVDLTDLAELQRKIQRYCRIEFAPARGRCLAVGMIVAANHQTPPEAAKLSQLINLLARRDATIQWIIWINEIAKSATATRIYLDGKTMSCYELVCRSLMDEGFALDVKTRWPSAIYKKIHELRQKMPWWLKMLSHFG